MGTILQEMGHDAIIIAFINSILKREYESLLYIVTPAMGPKRDIYYFDTKRKEYISGWASSKENYIPEFYYRTTIPKKEMDLLNKTSKYKKEDWYKSLSKKIGQDLKDFLSKICTKIEKYLKSDLPDILGFDEKGNLILFAEIKFEGFSQKAKESALTEYRLARKLEVPYYLVIPKNPVYSRGITNAWLKRNLPSDIRIYKFEIPTISVIPKQIEIQFIKV